MEQVVDLSAKLLANEDISVRRANTQTASFDIKTRSLTLPMWKEMTPQIEDMLVGHEVGHALYTTEEYRETIEENTAIKSYLNVLEDVRIEKLLKRKYPGMRKRMSEGYKQLNDRDFFGIEGKDVNKLLLIDRINLYYKATALIDFTPEEKQFVVRAEKTESIQDVIDLAKEVFAYAKAEYDKKMEEIQESDLENAEFEEDEDGDYEMELPQDPSQSYTDDEDAPEDDFEGLTSSNEQGDDEEDGFDSNSADPEPQYSNEESALESKTDKAFSENLEELADTDTEYKYWKFFDELPFEPVIGFKHIVPDLNKKIEERREGYEEVTAKLKQEFKTFKTETLKNVNYLVKEFEMRKSATAYKRTTTAKSGQLDMKKIYGYQINEDLFKRIAVVHEGKKHGMQILVDWSGSMHYVMTDTMKQVVNLALFCQRVQIPFQVLAFTTQWRNYSYEDRHHRDSDYRVYRDRVEAISKQSDTNYLAGHEFNLLELFSDKMSSAEFWKQAENLIDFRREYCSGYGLGSTPLNEALLWCYNNMGDFIRKNNVEKMTFITLTDGEGHDFSGLNSMFAEKELVQHGGWDRETDTRIPDKWKKVRNFIRDDITKKTYEISRNNTAQTQMMLKMIKDRYACRTVGFYICGNSKRDLYWAIKSNSKLSGYEVERTIPEMRANFRAEGFYSMTATGGRDEMFIISQRKMKIQEGDLNASGDMTARKLASNFSKYLNQKQTSRVLLNRFVGWVA